MHSLNFLDVHKTYTDLEKIEGKCDKWGTRSPTVKLNSGPLDHWIKIISTVLICLSVRSLGSIQSSCFFSVNQYFQSPPSFKIRVANFDLITCVHVR